MDKAKPEGYAVHYFTRYQDGHEEGGCVFKDLDAALEYMGSFRDPTAQTEFILFELGARVPFQKTKVTEKTTTRSERYRFTVE